ncbi:hypothetical protein D9758_001453 [Tetrapyrgos nigripes]|uniref:Uncharacterized protein n=1 Tax=Tetrapyrgos nigripes TaxID=182062 RepID=A0A8H5GXQ7_9AGAR|nr:hypothetical protein D9758_001453 [Tetrapyrgos nigripes]
MDFDSNARRDTTHMSSLGKRNTPRIGGTVGGFIALVVCLSLIIIIACTAIFIIVRNDRNETRHRPWNRSAVPERSWTKRKHRHSSGPSSSSRVMSYAYDSAGQPMSSPTHTPGHTPSRTWLASLAGMFKPDGGSHSRVPTSSSDTTVKQKPRSRGGWVQTANGDEWDADDGEYRNVGTGMSLRPGQVDLTNPSPAMSMIHSPSPHFGFNGAPVDSPFRPPSGSIYSSVPRYYPGRSSDRDRDMTPGSPSALSSGTASPVAMASAVPLRATSPDHMAGIRSESPMQTPPQAQEQALASPRPKPIPKHINPERKASVQTIESTQSVDSMHSGVSTRTFSGGTKFIEDI